jgi:hypothetical protein
VVSNLHDVVRLPIDMGCLNKELIQQISLKVPMGKLDKLVDKRDKLTSKIYAKKLENLFYILNEWNYEKKVHDFMWLESLNKELEVN